MWESLCLVQFRELGYLDRRCLCEDKRNAVHFEAHARSANRVFDAEPSTLHKIDRLTQDDRAAYAAAVRRVLVEVQAVEAAAGARILCGPAAARLQQSLSSYIPGLGSAVSATLWTQRLRDYARWGLWSL